MYILFVLVDQAVEAFAEQLDAGHKDSCSWRGNCCADSLVQFPPTLPSAIIGGYKDRCDGLLQFPFLPVVASSATETMRLTKSTKIDHLLAQPSGFFSGELGCKDDNNTGRKVSRDYSSCGHLPVSYSMLKNFLVQQLIFSRFLYALYLHLLDFLPMVGTKTYKSLWMGT